MTKVTQRIKYSFKNDYSEGAHPRILESLICTNSVQQEGYGNDEYCQNAREILQIKLQAHHADIHFVSGGTQANLIVISALLKPYEAVISASTGHVNTHETGAIEATGHKVIPVESSDGKLTPTDVQRVLDYHTDEHMVRPKLVYISNTTEVGTLYQKQELEDLYSFCQSRNLFLFLDGARLGSALSAKNNDVRLEDLPKLTDIFYIGGTKNGAMLGEAIVINQVELQGNFRYYLKQRGALLSKGRFLGVQFLELFKDDLYFDLASHANEMAEILTSKIGDLGYTFLAPSTTNQIFPIIPNSMIQKLSEKYSFYIWAKHDENSSAIRLVTSWATKEQAVQAFLNDMALIHNS